MFAHLAWNPFEPLTLTGGIRYTEESKAYTYGRFRPYNDPTSTTANSVLPLNGVTGLYEGDRFDFRANVQYAFTDDVMAYAQFSTGFKGGGVNPRPFFVQQAVPFNPETLDSYELGVKTDLFDRRVRLNVAAFLSKYKDMQLTLANCTAIAGAGFGVPCAMPVNAGDADVKGIEVETLITPIDGLSIDGSFSYLDFEYKRFGSFTARTRRPATDHGLRGRPDQHQRAAVRRLPALHPEVEVERRRPVRDRPRVGRVADPAVRRGIPGHDLHQRHQPADQPHRRLHAGERAAHLAQRRPRSRRVARSHQPVRQVLLPDRVRPDDRRRRLCHRPARAARANGRYRSRSGSDRRSPVRKGRGGLRGRPFYLRNGTARLVRVPARHSHSSGP